MSNNPGKKLQNGRKEQYLLPLEKGWIREVVYRSTHPKKRNARACSAFCDIYYKTPSGKKLRSLKDVVSLNEPLGVNDSTKEVIRNAKSCAPNKVLPDESSSSNGPTKDSNNTKTEYRMTTNCRVTHKSYTCGYRNYKPPIVEVTMGETEMSPKVSRTDKTDYYSCYHCLFYCQQKSSLRAHMKRHSPESLLKPYANAGKIFSCFHCNFKVGNKPHLRAHMNSHTKKNRPFRCKICGYTAKTPGHLDSHKIIHSARKPFECHHCHYKTRSYYRLKYHIERHFSVKIFTCHICNFRTSTRAKLDHHKMIHSGTKPYKCAQCDYRAARPDLLSSHELVHSGLKSYPCSVCTYRCKRRKDMKEHMNRHYGVKPFYCSFCDYKGTTAKCLRGHIRTHTGEKPYSCKLCHFQSAHRAALRKHMDGHNGIFRFVCPYCDYKTQYQTNLKYHMMFHEGDRPHSCPHCDMRFIARPQLNCHMRVHTGERPYACATCGLRFASSNGRNKHSKGCITKDTKPVGTEPKPEDVVAYYSVEGGGDESYYSDKDNTDEIQEDVFRHFTAEVPPKSEYVFLDEDTPIGEYNV